MHYASKEPINACGVGFHALGHTPASFKSNKGWLKSICLSFFEREITLCQLMRLSCKLYCHKITVHRFLSSVQEVFVLRKWFCLLVMWSTFQLAKMANNIPSVDSPHSRENIPKTKLELGLEYTKLLIVKTDAVRCLSLPLLSSCLPAILTSA